MMNIDNQYVASQEYTSNGQQQLRPKISVYIATSIDGYIARKDGSLDWLESVGGFDDDYGFNNLLNSIDAVIMGRKTYEIAASAPEAEWPYNGKRVIVLSRSLQTVKSGVELFSGEVSQLASQLYADGVKHVWVDGGVTVSQFLHAQMVDHMTLSVIPVVLGSGIPLFNAIDREFSCRLVSSQSYASGLVQLRYDIGSGKTL